MPERVEARIAAKKVLCRPESSDDYDLLNALARQFIRYDERLQKIVDIAEGSVTASSVPNIAKIARGES